MLAFLISVRYIAVVEFKFSDDALSATGQLNDQTKVLSQKLRDANSEYLSQKAETIRSIMVELKFEADRFDELIAGAKSGVEFLVAVEKITRIVYPLL